MDPDGPQQNATVKGPTSPQIVTNKQHSKHTWMRSIVLSIHSFMNIPITLLSPVHGLNQTESRGNPSLPCIREGSGEMTKGTHAERRQRKYLYRRVRASGGQRNLGKRNCPSRSRIRIQKTRKIQRGRFIHVTPKRTNYIHIHCRLVPPRGTGTRITGRMDEADLGQITRPKENATGELPHIPNEHFDPQDHEGKRIRQMRPM
jgi:hypothetical protein